MARKRKSRNNSKIGHGAISRIGRPHNPFEPRRNRYAQKYLTLVLMGGAVFLIVKGWSESSDVDNDGDGTFYSTVQDCIDDGNNADICARGWNNAKAAFYADVPKNMTQQNCQSKYENCYYDNVEQSWIPVVSGFLLSRVIRKDRDEPFGILAHFLGSVVRRAGALLQQRYRRILICGRLRRARDFLRNGRSFKPHVVLFDFIVRCRL